MKIINKNRKINRIKTYRINNLNVYLKNENKNFYLNKILIIIIN